MKYLCKTIFKTLNEFIFRLDIHENCFIFIALLLICGNYKSKINLFILFFLQCALWVHMAKTVHNSAILVTNGIVATSMESVCKPSPEMVTTPLTNRVAFSFIKHVKKYRVINCSSNQCHIVNFE